MKPRVHLLSPWPWFYLVLAVFCSYDFLWHIVRVDRSFGLYKLDWFVFSFGCFGAMMLVIESSKRVFYKVIKQRNLISDMAAICCAFIFHIEISGPFLNKLFIPQVKLTFFFNNITIAVLIGVYVTSWLGIKGIKILKTKKESRNGGTPSRD